MKKLLPVLFLFMVLKAFPTDLKLSISTPVNFVDTMDVNTPVDFTLRVDNQLYLAAEVLYGGVRIFSNQQYTDTAFNQTFTDVNLPAYTGKDYPIEQPFVPINPGKYYGYAFVYYEYDIDNTNDTVKFEMTFTETGGGCITDYEFLQGEGFKVEENLSYFPDDKTLAGYMQRGDVIGLSAKVSDKDYVHHLCICNDDTTSTLHGLYSDEVYYEWTLNGPGKLHIPDAKSGKIFYEIPVCVTTNLTATVNVKVKNGESSMASDDPISGSFTINIDACPSRIYPAGMTPDWNSSCLRVTVSKSNLSNGSDGQHSTKEDAACTPDGIVFDKGQEINAGSSIVKTEAEFCQPDYATLLSIEASDADAFTIKCEGEGACSSNDSVVVAISDPLKYEWKLISGKGEFPLGNTGSAVVFHKSRSEGATIECTISNIDSKSVDDVKKRTITLEAAKKPKAFVGLGDDEALVTAGSLIWGWRYSDDTYYGRNSGFKSAAESMKTKLENAGYEVEFWEHMTKTDLRLALQKPLMQAVVIVAHGSGGQLNMAGLDERIGTERFSSRDLVFANNQAYDCDESPRVRDLQLIGCEALRGSWRDGLHCKARLHGWRTTKFIASLRYYAYWEYKPLDPVNLSLP